MPLNKETKPNYHDTTSLNRIPVRLELRLSRDKPATNYHVPKHSKTFNLTDYFDKINTNDDWQYSSQEEKRKIIIE